MTNLLRTRSAKVLSLLLAFLLLLGNAPVPVWACEGGGSGRTKINCKELLRQLKEAAEKYQDDDLEEDADTGESSDTMENDGSDGFGIDTFNKSFMEGSNFDYTGMDAFSKYESFMDENDSFTLDFNYDEELDFGGRIIQEAGAFGGDINSKLLSADDVNIDSDFSFNFGEKDFSSCDRGGCGVDNSVDGFSGNLNLKIQLFTLDTIGVSVPIILYYNAQAEMKNGPFGYGWNLNWDITLKEYEPEEDEEGEIEDERDLMVRRKGDGGGYYYERYGTGWRPMEGHQGKLDKLGDGSWLETLKSGVKYYFTSYGRLEKVEDPHGNPVVLNYDTDGFIESIEDPSGRQIDFIRTGNKITDIVTPYPDGQTYSLDYTSGELERYEDPVGSYVDFGYSSDGMHLLNSRTYSTDFSVTYTYITGRRVSTRTKHNGGSNYTRYYQYQPGRITTTIDENGHKNVTKYNDFGQWVEQNNYGYENGQYILLATERRGYGADGSLLWSEDGRGNRTRYEYDDIGNRILMQVGKPASGGEYDWGPAVTYSYYPEGVAGAWHLQTETNARANTVSFTYYSNGDLKDKTWKVTNPDTSQIEIVGESRTYYSNGRLESVEDALGNVISYYYDIHGNLEKIIEPLGRETRYTYDVMGRRLSERRKIDDTRWQVTVYERDAVGRVSKVIYNENQSDYGQFHYDCCTLSWSCDRNGIVTYYEYYPSGKLHKKKLTISGVVNEYIYIYDGLDQLIQVTNPRGKNTWYTYDGLGRIIRITNALNEVTTLGYDANSNLVTKTVTLGQRNITTTIEYDEYNRMSRTINPIDQNTSASTWYSYDAGGNLTSFTDAENRVTTMAYNELGRIIRIEEPLDRITNFRYNASGDLVLIRDALQRDTTFAYDELHRLKHAYKPIDDCRTLHIEKQYDIIGNERYSTLHDVVDTEDHTSEKQYDLDCRMVKKIDPEGKIIDLQYYKGGQLKRIIDDNDVATYYEIDEAGRTKKITYAEGTADQRAEQFGYDGIGNLTYKTTRKGETITYVYDDIDRLDAKFRPDNKTVDYVYDDLGRIISITMTGYGVLSFGYDDYNRQTCAIDSGNRVISYTHDKAGNCTSITYPGGDNYTISYAYDELNRLNIIKDPQNIIVANYSYDALRRTRLDLQNGTYSSYSSYNKADWITLLANRKSESESISTFEYSYDRVGNRLSMERDSFLDEYNYNKRYELVRVDYDPEGSFNSQTFKYDGVGNRTEVLNGSTILYSCNSINEYITVGGIDYAYDLNGNLTDDGTQTYYYDCENQLTSVRNNFNAQTIAEYKYDPLGRRYVKIVGDTVTIYVLDGAREIEERNQSVLLRRYVYGFGIDEVLMMQKQDGSKYYYHYDDLGSVVNISNSNGSVVKNYNYQIYGAYSETGTLNGNSYTFTGRRWDSESNLYYYRNRYYSPTLGRFMQNDQIMIASELNLYKYCNNMPTNLCDPYGNKPGEGYTNERQMIIDAMNDAACATQKSEYRYEYSGAFYTKTDGKYYYTEPVQGGQVAEGTSKIIDVANAYASYHSHRKPFGSNPGITKNEYSNYYDKIGNRAKAMYVIDKYGNIYKFDAEEFRRLHVKGVEDFKEFNKLWEMITIVCED